MILFKNNNSLLMIKCKEQSQYFYNLQNYCRSTIPFIPFIDAREMPLRLHITLAALFDTLGVFREALFMLFLLKGNLGVAVTDGTWSVLASSATGEGVLMSDTEKRPSTLGVISLAFLEVDFLTGDGVTGFDFFPAGEALGEGDLDLRELFEGDAALGEEVLDFGDFFPGVDALGDWDLGFGDCLAGEAALGEEVLDFGDFLAGVDAFGDGDRDFGDCLAGDAALGEEALDFGDFFAGVDALGEGDLDFGDFLPGVEALGEAVFTLDVFLGDGVFFFAGLCTFEPAGSSCSNSCMKKKKQKKIQVK